jgi:hypothetical protein
MEQKVNRLWKIVPLMLVLLSLSGCYVTSKNPLPVKLEMDKELLGAWREVDVKKGSSHYSGYIVFAEDKGGWLQIMIMESYFEKGELYRGVCSEIAGEKYLNLKEVDFTEGGQRAELEENYTLIHYRITKNNRLEMAEFKEELFIKAVKEGQLAGILSPDGKDVTLTCTSEQLADFLRRHKVGEFLGEPNLLEKTSRLPKASKP